MKKSNIIFIIVGIILLIFLLITNIFKEEEEIAQPLEKVKETSDINPSVKENKPPESIKPKQKKRTEYTIIEKNCLLPYKCSLSIRIKEKINEGQLKELANKIKKSLSQKEQKANKIFIAYLLPNMKLNAGAWATSHFTPFLEIKIIGVSKEIDAKLKNNKVKYDGKVVGQWVQNQDKHVCAFVKKKGTLYFYNIYSDGSEGKVKLIKKRVDGKIRYYEKGRNTGEYFSINLSGNLEAYDEDGFIDLYTFTILKYN